MFYSHKPVFFSSNIFFFTLYILILYKRLNYNLFQGLYTYKHILYSCDFIILQIFIHIKIFCLNYFIYLVKTLVS